MLFTSPLFIVSLLLLWLLYYLKKLQPYQLQLLIVAGLLFYINISGWLLFVLVGSVLSNALLSYQLANSDNDRLRKIYVAGGVVLNVAILSFFKYGPLLGETYSDLTSRSADLLLSIALPIGISFYTFEGISLLVDTYKNKSTGYQSGKPVSLISHIQKTFLFISFFPHLVAGPILRANSFFPQIKPKFFKDIDLGYCFRKLVSGYFLKLVIANNLHDFTLALQSPYMESLSSFTLMILLIGYFCQMFADFAGYTKIALGLAGLFGYKLDENFYYPFVAKSLTEFWRRWHMTLSSFLRYYIYTIWLGNGRKGRVRAHLNIVITMIIGGFWHGAQWTFLLWGLIHGTGMVIEHFLKKLIIIPFKMLRNFVSWFITMAFITASITFFKFSSLHDIYVYTVSFFSNHHLPNDYRLITNTLIYMSPVIAMHLRYLFRDRFKNVILPKTDYVLYGVMLFFIITNSGQATSFIYFKF